MLVGLCVFGASRGSCTWCAASLGAADVGYSTVPVTAWARSTHRAGFEFHTGLYWGAELGLSLAFLVCTALSISSLPCQRRCALG